MKKSLTFNSPELKPLLQEILTEIQNILKEKLRGLYLYGSLVGGDFVDNISDIDLFALLTEALDEHEFERLDDFHHQFVMEHPLWESRLEIAYLSSQALATFRTHQSPIAVVSPGEPFNLKQAGMDWAINWYILRQQGHVLAGPPVDQVFPEISEQEFIQIVRQQTLEWGDWIVNTRDSTRYQAYAVVTICRAMYVVTFGSQPSKRKAADWIKTNFPSWAELIDWAFEIRIAEDQMVPTPSKSYDKVVTFVQFAIEKVQTF